MIKAQPAPPPKEVPDEEVLNGEEAAIQRQRAVNRATAMGELTGGIAHDFRNLLAAIDAGLRLADKHASDPVAVKQFIAAARVAIQDGVSLTSKLLNFAKHQALHVHQGNINDFLTSFEPFLRYGAGPDMRLVLSLDPELPPCLVEPSLLNAAVLNLVCNARDATSGGGVIHVTTERIEPSEEGAATVIAAVRVADNGIGMPQDVLEKIFESFYTTKGDKGTGVGMKQVRSFVDAVGGTIHISSTVGVGTTVELRFPSAQ